MSSSNSQPEHIVDWSVENFSMIMRGAERTTSKDFRTGILQETSWRAVLYAHGQKNSEDCIVVGLERSSYDDGPSKIDLRWSACVIAADGSEHADQETIKDGIAKCENAFCRIVERDFLFSNVWKFLPENTLTIRFKISNHILPAFTRTVATTLVRSELVEFNHTISDLNCSCAHGFTVSKVFDEPLSLEILFDPAKQGNEEATSETQLVVQVVGEWKKDFHMWGSISVLDSKDTPRLTKESDNLFVAKESGKWTFPNFFTLKKLREEKEELLPESKLTLKFAFLVFDRELNTNMGKKMKLVCHEKRTLSRDMQTLFKSGLYPDVKLRTQDGRKQTAHRWLLSSRSQVFLNMFEKEALDNAIEQNGKCEKMDISANELAPAIQKTDVVNVPDMDYVTLNCLLHYLYSDESCKMEFDVCLRLYSASVLFRNVSLKAKCLDFLKRHFDSKNVYDVLILADRTGESQLRLAAQDYIAQHSDIILLTDEWQEFVEQKPALAKLVMCDLRVRYQEKCSEAFVM